VEILIEEEEEEEEEENNYDDFKETVFWDVTLACGVFKVGILLSSLVDQEDGGSILRRTLARLRYVTYCRVELFIISTMRNVQYFVSASCFHSIVP
jgi:hypothetical protein